MATTLLRRRIVEDFTPDKGLKLELVSAQIGFVLAGIIAKLRTVLAGVCEGYPRSAASATVLDHQWSRD